MKEPINTKKNIQLLEDLVRTISKGYYSDFKEDQEKIVDTLELVVEIEKKEENK